MTINRFIASEDLTIVKRFSTVDIEVLDTEQSFLAHSSGAGDITLPPNAAFDHLTVIGKRNMIRQTKKSDPS
jgi:hypothetical protein